MNIRAFICRIEQQHKEQNSLYHAVAEKYGLSDETRWFAYESLNHKYGLDTVWNARFVTLNKEWQDMIISQTEDVVL